MANEKALGRGLHREREQPAARKKLGYLEKKKDYRKRAADHNRKRDKLKRLRQLAADKNPDEFYHRMISTKLKNGVHIKDKTEDISTPEQKLIEETQTHSYVTSKLVSESNKIERLKKGLQFIRTDGGNSDLQERAHQHIVFVENDDAAEKFDAVKYFNTAEELINSTSHRPKLEQLKTCNYERTNKAETSEKWKSYRELENRLERKKKLQVMEAKLQQKKNLKDKYNKPIAKLASETPDAPAVYKWSYKRRK